MCFTLGASIAEIVSAYPTCGGLYVTSSTHLTSVTNSLSLSPAGTRLPLNLFLSDTVLRCEIDGTKNAGDGVLTNP